MNERGTANVQKGAVQPLLSIAMPSYNVEAYLRTGLDSLCDERLRGRVEVLVVNDGSTDGTLALARAYEQREPAIFRVVDKPNGGHGSAVNAGLAAARGRYFRVVDGDDWVDTENLVALLQVLAQTQADLVVDEKCEQNMVTGARVHFPLPADLRNAGELPFSEVCGRADITELIMIHTLMLRTEYARAVGLQLLEHTFYVDFEYIVKGTLRAQTLRFVPLNVYQYLVGNASQSVADASYVRRWDDHTRVTAEILRLYEAEYAQLPPERAAYLQRRAMLVCNTHYNIALIFDDNRSRGLCRAREFRTFLRAEHPSIAQLTERRYKLARALHALGVNSQEKLNKLRG